MVFGRTKITSNQFITGARRHLKRVLIPQSPHRLPGITLCWTFPSVIAVIDSQHTSVARPEIVRCTSCSVLHESLAGGVLVCIYSSCFGLNKAKHLRGFVAANVIRHLRPGGTFERHLRAGSRVVIFFGCFFPLVWPHGQMEL